MAVMQASEANINFVKTRLASPDGKLWGKAPGMVLLKPTSIAHSGTSASIGENGQVTFSAVTSLSLNGVFSADFDNYAISLRGQGSANGLSSTFQLRASGTNATGSDYTRQRLEVDNTTVSGQRSTSQTSMFQPAIFYTSVVNQAGLWFNLYGPFLAQPTAARAVAVHAYAGAYIFETAFTHSLSTSYDGFTFAVTSGNITGALQVYGIRS